MSFTLESFHSSTSDAKRITIDKLISDLNILIDVCRDLLTLAHSSFDAEVRQNLRDKCSSIEDGLSLIKIIFEEYDITDSWWTERVITVFPVGFINLMNDLRRIQREITRMSRKFDSLLVKWWNSPVPM